MGLGQSRESNSCFGARASKICGGTGQDTDHDIDTDRSDTDDEDSFDSSQEPKKMDKNHNEPKQKSESNQGQIKQPKEEIDSNNMNSNESNQTDENEHDIKPNNDNPMHYPAINDKNSDGQHPILPTAVFDIHPATLDIISNSLFDHNSTVNIQTQTQYEPSKENTASPRSPLTNASPMGSPTLPKQGTVVIHDEGNWIDLLDDNKESDDESTGSDHSNVSENTQREIAEFKKKNDSESLKMKAVKKDLLSPNNLLSPDQTEREVQLYRPNTATEWTQDDLNETAEEMKEHLELLQSVSIKMDNINMNNDDNEMDANDNDSNVESKKFTITISPTNDENNNKHTRTDSKTRALFRITSANEWSDTEMNKKEQEIQLFMKSNSLQ